MICRLSELTLGAQGIIESFDNNDAEIKFMEMGCLPGEAVSVAAIAPLGDPIAIFISGYNLSLRKQDARHIWVRTPA